MSSNEELAIQYQETKSNKVFNELMDQNIGLVKIICQGFVQNKDEEQDFHQEAFIAFERAAKTFKCEKNVKFTTWAAFLIKNQLIAFKDLMHPRGLYFTPLEVTHYPSYKENYGAILDLKTALAKLPNWKRNAVTKHFFSSGPVTRSERMMSQWARDDMKVFLERPPRR